MSDASFEGDDGTAGGEDEAEHVIIDDLIEGVFECVGRPLLLRLEFAGNLSMLFEEHAGGAAGNRWRGAWRPS